MKTNPTSPKSQVMDVRIVFKSGRETTYEDIHSVQVMPEGFFYVQLKDDDRLVTDSGVRAKTNRLWFNNEVIDHIEMETETLISGELEVLKYKKFMEHGIDMVHQAVSYTAPPDVKEVEKKVNQDKHVQIKNEQLARKANEKKRKG